MSRKGMIASIISFKAALGAKRLINITLGSKRDQTKNKRLAKR